MEPIRQKIVDSGRYHELRPLGRRTQSGKGAVAEDLGQTKFTNHATTRPKSVGVDSGDEIPPSRKGVSISKRSRRPVSQHGSSPLEELSPNSVKKSKGSKSRINKLKVESSSVKKGYCATTATSKKRVPEHLPPKPAAFPMEVPSQPQPRSRRQKPAPAPFPFPSSPQVKDRTGAREKLIFNSLSTSPRKDDSDEDELNITDNDLILTHGGPRPFPMSLYQFPEASSPSSNSPSSKRPPSLEGGSRVSKKARPSVKNLGLSSGRSSSSTSEPEDLGFLSFHEDDIADPSTVCPYCDEPWPPSPSPTLISLLERIKRKSYHDPRPGNPMGLRAPLAVFVELCQQHRFEMTHLPLARARGWPTRLDFASLPKRIAAFKKELGRFVYKPENSVFWREIRDEAKEVGIMKVVSVIGQYATFGRAQPGYYGEQGSIIIHQSLYTLFPPDIIPPATVAPLTPDQFLTRVLVPETAALLIQADMNLPTKAAALQVLDESRKYGIAMFPEQEQGGEAAEVGEHLARERARVRRKVLEERGEADADVKREVEQERWVAKKASKKGSNATGKVDARQSDTESELGQESREEGRWRKGGQKGKELANHSPTRSVDVSTINEFQEPTPRPAKVAGRRAGSTMSRMSKSLPVSSPDEVVDLSSSSSPAPESTPVPLRSANEKAQWFYNLHEPPSSDIDFDDVIANRSRKRSVTDISDPDSDCMVTEAKGTPKKSKLPRTVGAMTIQSEDDTEDSSDVATKSEPKYRKKEYMMSRDGDVKMNGTLGQTRRRKKVKQPVERVQLDREPDSHSWLLSD